MTFLYDHSHEDENDIRAHQYGDADGLGSLRGLSFVLVLEAIGTIITITFGAIYYFFTH